MGRPRIRTIKPEFFEDERITSLPIPARFVVIGLISRADDRGREHDIPLAILGYVFPCEKVELGQLREWLDLIVGARIALRYEAGSHRYLWLPNFWRHQKINRPTESQLPAHPDDPYAQLGIEEGLEAFRRANLNHGDLTEDSSPRAGARAGPRGSFPFLSSTTTNNNGRTPVVAREKSRRVDQDKPPASLPEKLRPVLADALKILGDVQRERGGNIPTVRGAGLALAAHPDRDHVAVARELEHWALAGNGQGKAVKDWARTYATFLERAVAGAPVRTREQPQATGGAVVDVLNSRGPA